ncbi:hypothetical protein B0H13DRAFT_1874823 [Mycena leptocephala]|nr:hypothetical protein B0H13DRAFT_1874823 [Mycena leptocephala]
MGYTNGRCMLDYIRVIGESISQHEYKDLISMFGIVNEAYLPGIGRYDLLVRPPPSLASFCCSTGTTTHLPPSTQHDLASLSIHDGSQGTTSRASFPLGSDRMILDTHPYFAFDGAPNDSPIAPSAVPLEVQLVGTLFDYEAETARYGQTRAHGTSQRQAVRPRADDARSDWFFWTWKVSIPLMDDDVQIGPTLDGIMRSPLWSYQLGLQTGFMPIDPRDSRLAGQTGSTGAGTTASAAVQLFGQWPPATLPNAEASATPLPAYTATASITSLMFVTPVTSCPLARRCWGVHEDAVAVIWAAASIFLYHLFVALCFLPT